MVKRDIGAKRTNTRTVDRGSVAASASSADTLEQKVVAFAEQLGRVVGTVQAKTEGWMDREALNKQMASIRDGAAALLEQVADKATGGSTQKPADATAKRASQGRSGSVVDAPGKKHRKPMPSDARATAADTQASKMRASKPMVKTARLRGRG